MTEQYIEIKTQGRSHCDEITQNFKNTQGVSISNYEYQYINHLGLKNAPSNSRVIQNNVESERKQTQREFHKKDNEHDEEKIVFKNMDDGILVYRQIEYCDV